MARINIEDSLWKDFRFQELMIKVGSRHAAKGMILELWTLAQEYWFPNRTHIPPEKIKESGLQIVVDIGLAELRDGGYFAVGSEKAFDWLFEAQKRGQASVESRRKKYGSAQPVKKSKASRKQVNNNPTSPESDRSSYSLLSSLPLSSSSDSISNSLNLSGGVLETPSRTGITIATWEAYREAYQKRYQEFPIRNATISGQLAQFVKRVGESEAPLVAAFYLTHGDGFYTRSMHSVGLMLRDAEKLRTEWATGRKVTGAQVRQAEKMSGYEEQLKRIEEGKL